MSNARQIVYFKCTARHPPKFGNADIMVELDRNTLKHIILDLIWGSRVDPPQGVSGSHPYLIMGGYTLYVPVLRCCRLTKMLWAAALFVIKIFFVYETSFYKFIYFDVLYLKLLLVSNPVSICH